MVSVSVALAIVLAFEVAVDVAVACAVPVDVAVAVAVAFAVLTFGVDVAVVHNRICSGSINRYDTGNLLLCGTRRRIGSIAIAITITIATTISIVVRSCSSSCWLVRNAVGS